MCTRKLSRTAPSADQAQRGGSLCSVHRPGSRRCSQGLLWAAASPKSQKGSALQACSCWPRVCGSWLWTHPRGRAAPARCVYRSLSPEDGWRSCAQAMHVRSCRTDAGGRIERTRVSSRVSQLPQAAEIASASGLAGRTEASAKAPLGDPRGCRTSTALGHGGPGAPASPRTSDRAGIGSRQTPLFRSPGRRHCPPLWRSSLEIPGTLWQPALRHTAGTFLPSEGSKECSASRRGTFRGATRRKTAYPAPGLTNTPAT